MSLCYVVSKCGIIQCQKHDFLQMFFSTLFAAYIMSCVGLMNDVTRVYWEHHVQSPFIPGLHSSY